MISLRSTRIALLFLVTWTALVPVSSRAAAVVGLGSSILFEKTNDRRSETAIVPFQFSVGFGTSRWVHRIGYSFDQSINGNATLSVRRQRENLVAWTSYDFGSSQGWVPYGSLGLGFTRTDVETRLAAQNERSSEAWQGMFGLAGGFRSYWTEWLAVRIEVRMESAAAFQLNDSRSGVAAYLDIQI